MRIMSWNMNYWNNTLGKQDIVIKWKNKCIEYLKNEKDVDFYLLQEINPFKLFEKMPNQYFFSMSDYHILYHELKSELLFDGRSDNFWGNAILFNKNYEVVKNNIEIDVNLYYKNYYGRNAIMCYDFKSPDGKTITIANIYNKINYANKGMYNFLGNFREDSDIQKIIRRNNNFILAGDFNTGYIEKYPERYNELCESLKGFKNCALGKPEEFKKTFYSSKEKKMYLNDFCFVSENLYDSNSIKKFRIHDDWTKYDYGQKNWNGLSDHYPIIVDFSMQEINTENKESPEKSSQAAKEYIVRPATDADVKAAVKNFKALFDEFHK